MQDVLSKNKTKRYFYTYLIIENQSQVGEVSLNQLRILLKGLISFGAVVLNGATLDSKSKSKPSADLEVQLVQLNHYDGVYSNY